MRVLITGNEGFIGKHMQNRLLEEGHEVLPMDLKNGRDILTVELPEVDKVIHLAAQTDAFCKDAYKDAETNILGTIRLMEKYGSKLIFISSGMVNYLHAPYAISKACGEIYARYFDCAIVRLTNVYGKGGHSCLDKFREADVMKIYGTGKQVRTYAPIEDACNLIMKAMNEGGYHVLFGQKKTVNELADMFDKPREYLPERELDLINAIQL